MSALPAEEASVSITSKAMRGIAALAQRAVPEEACGVLVGRDGEHAMIEHAWGLGNQAQRYRHRRFRIAPEQLVEHAARARALRLDIIGFFHSHPEGDALPSARDVREGSGWPGYVNAIYACKPGPQHPRLRFYRTHMVCWREIPMKGIHP